jgi:thioredoxin 1
MTSGPLRWRARAAITSTGVLTTATDTREPSMRPRPSLTLIATAGVSALLLSACGSATEDTAAPAASSATSATASASTAPSASPAASPTTSPSATGETLAAGAYLTKAEYQSQMAQRAGTKVVYFFHAPWCPTCRATEKAIDEDGIPAGLTVVKVDFDSETDLRKTYGITQQHTFVQVDEDGDELAKWTGSITGAEIKAKTV